MTLTTMLLAGVVIAFPGRKRREAWREKFLADGGCLLPPPMILDEEPPPPPAPEPDDGDGIDCHLPAYVVEDEPPPPPPPVR